MEFGNTILVSEKRSLEHLMLSGRDRTSFFLNVQSLNLNDNSVVLSRFYSVSQFFIYACAILILLEF